MNTNLIDILKKRLATGEILIDEYRLLLLEISDKSFDSELLVNKNTYQKRDTGGGIDDIDDFKLYENMMIYKGNSYKFYDIVSIIEEQSSSSVNFPL